MPGDARYPLTTCQAAEYLGFSDDTVVKWVRQGKIQAILTPGGRLRYSHADLDEFLEGLATRSEATA